MIVGGRNESNNSLSDLHIFFLERETWVGIRTPKNFIPRCNFGVDFLDDSFVATETATCLYLED